MKSRMVAIGLGLLLVATAAEAGWFSRRNDSPKAVDSPIVRPKVKDAHKFGQMVHHPGAKYRHPEWGSNWTRAPKARDAHFVHAIFER